MKSGIIKKISNDHWAGFLKLYGKKIRKNVKKVGFTCKSRFCTSCGKVYTDKWVDNMIGELINVKHRHIVFTIPEELREFF